MLCSRRGGWMDAGLTLESRWCLEQVVPYVQQLVLAQVSVEGGVLHADEHGLLDGPGMAVNFLVHYAELVGLHGMSCGSAVVVYGGGGFEVFLYPFTQRSAWLFYVCTGAVYVGALVMVNNLCLVVWGPCPWDCLGLSWGCWCL